jgi:hypothetical protein
MNERIAKLYDQAIVVEDAGDYVCGELDPVKFAELIIKECADTVLGFHNQFGDSAHAEIKQHFGVE